jgi:hypothetical protein
VEEVTAGQPHYLRGVRSYRDRSLEKDERFPFKLSKSGPDNSKRIVRRPPLGSIRGELRPLVTFYNIKLIHYCRRLLSNLLKYIK